MDNLLKDHSHPPYILIAILIWFLTSYPAGHLRDIYIWHHHTLGALGLHPELVDAYIIKAAWETALLFVLCPFIIWVAVKVISSRTKVDFVDSLVVGPIVGLLASSLIYSQLGPRFLAITNVQLGNGTFLYSGLLSGILAGELCRRHYLSSAGILPTGQALRRQFVLAALLTWSVLLQILESFYLSSLPPGRDPVGIHLFMLTSVLLWTPLACRLLGKSWFPTLIPSLAITVALGIVFPFLVGWLLFFPVVILLYAGVTPSAYGLLWGILLLKVSGSKFLVATISVLPGLLWGLVVGTLRWWVAPA